MREEIRPHSWARGLGSLLLVMVCVFLPEVASARSDSGIGLPEEDLSGLEPAVASQLDSLDAQARDRLSDPAASREIQAEAVGDLGRHYHAYELTEAAETCYRTAQSLAPEDFRWPYFLGYLLQSAGRLEEAEAEYLTALAIYRRVPPALLRLGEVYRALGRIEAAERLFQESLSLDASSAATQAALGELYGGMGRHDEAVRLLERALDSEPEATRLYYPLALAYRARGDHERARDFLARRGPVGIKPADPLIDGLDELKTGERAFLLEGQSAFRAGRYEEATSAFAKAVEAAPESVAARIDLGSALGEQGQIDAALVQYDRALEIASENPTALFNAGLLRARRGDLDIALEHLHLASEIEPEDAIIRIRLADVSRLAGKLDDALLHYRAASELEPGNEGALLGEAQILVSLDRSREAVDLLEQGLVQIPTSGQLAHALSRILAMGPDLSIRDGARALPLAESVLAARPTPANAEVVAAALAELDRCEEAARLQKQVLEKTEDEALKASRRQVLDLYKRGPRCGYPSE